MGISPSSPSDSIVYSIVQSVAKKEGEDPTELPPLSRSMDTDALESIVEDPPEDFFIKFEYVDYTVRIDSDGSVTVE